MRRPSARLIAWAAAGVAVVATGTAYATGFASTANTTADPANGAATPLFGQPPAPDPALYPNAITTFPLPIGWDGLTGQVAHDTDVFTVSVPATDARTGAAYPGGTTFALHVVVTDQPDLVGGAGGHTPWTTLQLQWSLAPCPGGAFSDETSAAPTFASPLVQALMPVTTGTIEATLTGLAPGTVYCAGVKQAYPDATDPAGTDLARPYATDADAQAANPAWTSAVPVAPQLTAQLQRTS
jgi:hypothetical protein